NRRRAILPSGARRGVLVGPARSWVSLPGGSLAEAETKLPVPGSAFANEPVIPRYRPTIPTHDTGPRKKPPAAERAGGDGRGDAEAIKLGSGTQKWPGR